MKFAGFAPCGLVVLALALGSCYETHDDSLDPPHRHDSGVDPPHRYDSGVDPPHGDDSGVDPPHRHDSGVDEVDGSLDAALDGPAIVPVCGNGVIEPGEACDDGPQNDDDRPDACRSDCRAPWCGDGVRDDSNGEACDDGPQNDDIEPGACRTNCSFAGCSDTVASAHELPDDGAGSLMEGNVLLLHLNDRIVDSTVAVRHAVGHNGASMTEGGKLGGAAAFDGRDDYLSFDNGSIHALGQHTVAMWVQRQGAGTDDPRLFLSGDADTSIALTQDGRGQNLRYRIIVDGSAHELTTNTNPLTNDTWVHVVATFDGANQRLYADGVEIASAPEEGTVRGSAGTYGYIGGGSSDGRDSSFDGMIDEVSVWSRALSDEEVSGLYNQGTGRVVLPDEAGVVALYHLDDCRADVRDTSGGGHDGDAYGDGSAPNGGLRALIYGESNGALEFVGDGWIVTGSLPFDDTLTVAFWMKSDVDPQTFNSAIMGQCNAENGCIGWVIGHQGGNLYYNPGGYFTPDDTFLYDGAWHHVVVRNDGWTLSTFRDGTERWREDCHDCRPENPYLFSLGIDELFSLNTWRGELDEVAVWNRPLSDDEILEVYSLGLH